MRRLRLFYKVLSNKVQKYIYELIPLTKNSFRNRHLFTAFPCMTEHLKNFFFQNDCNKLDSKFCNSIFVSSFKNPLKKSQCPSLDRQRKKSTIFMTRSVLNYDFVLWFYVYLLRSKKKTCAYTKLQNNHNVSKEHLFLS